MIVCVETKPMCARYNHILINMLRQSQRLLIFDVRKANKPVLVLKHTFHLFFILTHPFSVHDYNPLCTRLHKLYADFNLQLHSYIVGMLALSTHYISFPLTLQSLSLSLCAVESCPSPSYTCNDPACRECTCPPECCPECCPQWSPCPPDC